MTEQIESEASEQPLGQMTKGMEGRTSAQARRSRRPARTVGFAADGSPRAVAVAARREWRKIAAGSSHMFMPSEGSRPGSRIWRPRRNLPRRPGAPTLPAKPINPGLP